MAFDIIDPKCGKRFLRYIGDERPQMNMPISLNDYVHTDGSSLMADRLVVDKELCCDSCGEPAGEMFPGSVWESWAHPEYWVEVEE